MYFLCYFDVDKGTPVARLVSLKPTPGKDAATNANEDMINIASIKADVARHGGSCTDHAAVAEGKALGKLVIAKAKEEATNLRPAGVVSGSRRNPKVQATLGDEQHKHPLVWMAIDNGTFGPDDGSIHNKHHKELLCQLWCMLS